MRACRRPLLALAGLFAALGLLAPAAARAGVGGVMAPSGPRPGGAEFGQPSGPPSAARPIARVFSVAPQAMVAGRVPRIAVRIDQRGVPRVSARIVFWPLHGNGTVLRIDLGRVPTGRLLHPHWPKGVRLAPGRYLVRLHALGPYGATLQRRAHASGKAPLTVRPKPQPKPTPAPAPTPSPAPAPGPVVTPPVAPVTPVVTSDGVFPVQGAHSFGGADGRFGAGRPGHIHQGQDVVAAEGTPVVAPLAGTIVARDYQAKAAGFYLTEDAADGRSFFFAHCQKDTFAVALGQAVAAGQQLCRVGQTGDASGPHLHFEIWVGGWRRSADSHPVDPLAQLQAWDR